MNSNKNKNNLVVSFQDQFIEEEEEEEEEEIDEYIQRFLISEALSEATVGIATSIATVRNEATVSNEETNQICLAHEYDASYSAKDLLKICEFYGIHKECKKYKKMELIYAILIYESDETHSFLVEKRKAFWELMSMLKQDKFMKQFIVW